MSSLKQQLIRLGNTNPSLRPHLRPILDEVTNKTSYGYHDRFDYLSGDDGPDVEDMVYEAVERNESLANRAGIKGMWNLGSDNFDEDVEYGRGGGVSAKVINNLTETQSLDELVKIFNSPAGKAWATFPEFRYPISKSDILNHSRYIAVDLGGDPYDHIHENYMEVKSGNLYLIANFNW